MTNEPLLLRVARGEGRSLSGHPLCDFSFGRRGGKNTRMAYASSRTLHGGFSQVCQRLWQRAFMSLSSRFSDRYPFRLRSETPDIAVELSLQPFRAFQTDGVIMFSDILTPLPAMGVEFDVIKGMGPRIEQPIRTEEDLRRLLPLEDPSEKLGFVGETLERLRNEIYQTDAALIGFIGTPWTLAAYCVEGMATKNCLVTKVCLKGHRQSRCACHEADVDASATRDSASHSAALNPIPHPTSALSDRLRCHQFDESSMEQWSVLGAQIVQLFDSWAHHLSPEQFRIFSLPYAESIIRAIKDEHPDVPVVFHMNGGTGKLEFMSSCSADVIGLDWHVEMQTARALLGDRILQVTSASFTVEECMHWPYMQGNVDPLELCGTEASLTEAVERCLSQAGGSRHILNLGHGVVQQTPEEHVRLFCDLAKKRTASAVTALP